MRIAIQPPGFHIRDEKLQTPGGEIDAKTVSIIDQSGIAVEVTFGETDWEAFQRYIADPVAETKRQEARAKLLMAKPGQPLPKIDGNRR